MRVYSRANRTALRRAAGASVALHAVAAGALVCLLRTGDPPEPIPPGIDTRAADQPQVRMHLVEEAPAGVEVQPESAPAKPPMAVPTGPPLAASRAAPRVLPPELLALIRKPAPVEALTPTSTPGAVSDLNVKPAVATGAKVGTSIAPIHGALKSDQTVVYVLDCSGSMGAGGKFDRARAALVTTLAQQPPTVRFQVIVFAGSAVPLLASGRAALPASAANVQAAAEKLAALEARGKTSHLEAIRAALGFRPDVIVILTDADDLSAAKLKAVFAGEPKPVPVCVGHVTAEGVQRPRELK